MRFTERDRADIARIRELYGLDTDIAAVRLALHVAAHQQRTLKAKDMGYDQGPGSE